MMFCGVSLGWEVSLCSIKDYFHELLARYITLTLFFRMQNMQQLQDDCPTHIVFVAISLVNFGVYGYLIHYQGRIL